MPPSSIRLHEKHGLNPTMLVCYWCGEETKEIALLGRAYRAKAPSYLVLSKEPCEKCRARMKEGVILVSACSSPNVEPILTGKYCVVKDEAVSRLFSEEMAQSALERRIAYVDDAAWSALGLPE